jgi:hypothetical protein
MRKINGLNFKTKKEYYFDITIITSKMAYNPPPPQDSTSPIQKESTVYRRLGLRYKCGKGGGTKGTKERAIC